jgi:hypothetical protein
MSHLKDIVIEPLIMCNAYRQRWTRISTARKSQFPAPLRIFEVWRVGQGCIL